MGTHGAATGAAHRGAAAAALAAGLLCLASCAAGPRQLLATGAPLAGHPRVAFLPLENLSGREDAGDVLTSIFFAELVRTGVCDVVEAGQVEGVLQALRIRATGLLTHAQLKSLGDTLGVPFVLTGTVLESGTTRTPEGDVPAVGVALKLLEVSGGRVVWARTGFRTGDDRETVFGWGREPNAAKLSAQLAGDMLRDFSRLAGNASGRGGAR